MLMASCNGGSRLHVRETKEREREQNDVACDLITWDTRQTQ